MYFLLCIKRLNSSPLFNSFLPFSPPRLLSRPGEPNESTRFTYIQFLLCFYVGFYCNPWCKSPHGRFFAFSLLAFPVVGKQRKERCRHIEVNLLDFAPRNLELSCLEWKSGNPILNYSKLHLLFYPFLRANKLFCDRKFWIRKRHFTSSRLKNDLLNDGSYILRYFNAKLLLVSLMTLCISKKN